MTESNAQRIGPSGKCPAANQDGSGPVRFFVLIACFLSAVLLGARLLPGPRTQERLKVEAFLREQVERSDLPDWRRDAMRKALANERGMAAAVGDE